MSDKKSKKSRRKKSKHIDFTADFTYKGICLSSGGYKGFGMLGFLTMMKLWGYFKDTNMYCGCSIGSIITVLLAVGWTPIEIFKKAINIKVFNGIQDLELDNFKDNMGIMSNKGLSDQLEDFILMKRNNIPTLLEFYEEGIYIAFSTTDSISKREYKIDWSTSPNVLITEGAIWSANIPGVFPPVKIDGMAIVDGALTNPFPINYIDKGDDGPRILGLAVYGESEDDTNSIISYIIGCMMTSIDQLQRKSVHQASKSCHIIELHIIDHDVLDPSDAHGAKTGMFFRGMKDAKVFLKALKSSKKRQPKLPKPNTRTNIRFFPDSLLMKCLISQPLDVLCQAASTNLEAISTNINNLPPKKLMRLKAFAREIIKDELIAARVTIDHQNIPKETNDFVTINENYSQKVYDNLPLPFRSAAKVIIDSLDKNDASNTIYGINIIFEGLNRMGLNILDTPLIEQPKITIIHDEQNDDKNSSRIEEID